MNISFHLSFFIFLLDVVEAKGEDLEDDLKEDVSPVGLPLVRLSGR